MRKFLLATALGLAFVSPARADLVEYNQVKFISENHPSPTTYKNHWTQLVFEVDGFKVSGKCYHNCKITFSLEHQSGYPFRSDIRVNGPLSWRGGIIFSELRDANGRVSQDLYLESGPLPRAVSESISEFTSEEKIVLAWIVTHSEELIDFAVQTNRVGPLNSAEVWRKIGNNFEKNVRSNFSIIGAQIRAFDGVLSHNDETQLKEIIQPALFSLNLYDGPIDGRLGPKTDAAIRAFERANNLFPDGFLMTSELKTLQELGKDPHQAIFELQVRMTQVKNILALREREFAESEKDFRSQIRILTSRLGVAQAKLQTCLEDVDPNADKTMASLRGYVRNLTDQIDVLKYQKKSLSENAASEARTLRTEIERLQDKLGEAQADKAVSDAKISDLSSRLEIAVKGVDGESARVTALAADLAEAKTKGTRLENEKSSLQRDLNAAILETNVIPDLQAQLQLKAADVVRLTAEVAFKDDIIAGLNKKIQSSAGYGAVTFTLPNSWQSVASSVPIQQLRFCTLLEVYKVQAKNALDSGNQLKQNLAISQRDDDLMALLPRGDFRDWVVEVEEIYQTPDGDAAFLLNLPCGVTIGSGTLVGGDTEQWVASAARGGVIFKQLSQLSQGDRVLLSGTFLTYSKGDVADGKPRFITNISGQETVVLDSGRALTHGRPDYYAKIEYLSKL